MSLTPDIVKNLICSQCKLYLSAFPVKVYPNRQVKCARCTEENDGGTISQLYDVVAQHLKFPCNYNYEGCRQLLSPYETLEHEQTCSKKIGNISCYCSSEPPKFCSVALFLNHVKTSHSEKFLSSLQFYVNLDENKTVTKMFDFICCKNNHALLIKYSYSKNTKCLVLCIKHFRAQTLEMFKYKVLLYSLGNKLKKKTGDYYVDSLPKRVNILIRPEDYSKNILICRILLDDQPELIIKENYIVPYSEAFDRAHFKCTFKDVPSLNKDQKIYSPTHYVSYIPWKIYIKKIQHENTYLGIFLEVDLELQKKIVATVGVTLLSCERNKNKSVVLEQRDFKANKVWGLSNFIAWTELCTPSNGFVHNGWMNVEAEIKYVEIQLPGKHTSPLPEHVCKKSKFKIDF